MNDPENYIDPINMVNSDDKVMYDFLFDNAPVSLWEEDYSEIIELLNQISETDKTDLPAYFDNHPEKLDQMIAGIKIVNVNRETLDWMKCGSKEKLIRELESSFTRDSREVFISELQNIVAGIYRYDFKTKLVTLDGEERFVSMRIRVKKNALGEPLYNRVLVAINDITEIRESEIAHREEKNRTERYLNLANVLFLSLDRNGAITMANRKLCDILELEPDAVIGQNWIDSFVLEDDIDELKQLISNLLQGYSEEVKHVESHIVSSTNEVFTIEWFHTILRNEQGEIVEIVASGNDVTRERRLEIKNTEMEAQIQHTQKLNSISTLARGVAHEINNPLTGLLNYANILEDEIEDPELKEFAQGVQKEGTRVAKIVSNLLSFARMDVKTKRKLKISEVIEKAVMLINQSLLTDNIHLEFGGQGDDLFIHGQEQELQHAILNLITNSWQAINRKEYQADEKSLITINTSLVENADSRLVRILMEDNGQGIKEKHINNVFDPFYSGSKRVRRVGMGLAVAYGIISDHGGSISIASTYGQGTQVTIDMDYYSGEGHIEKGA